MNLPPSIKKKEEIQSHKNFKFSTGYRLVYITVSMFFAGSILAVTFGFMTMIGIFEFLRLFSLVIVIAYLIEWLFFSTVFHFRRMEQLAVATIGGGPLLLGILMVLNFYVSKSHTDEFHTLKKVSHQSGYAYFDVDGLPCEQYPELCSTLTQDKKFKRGARVRIRISTGILGFKVLREIELVSSTQNNREV